MAANTERPRMSPRSNVNHALVAGTIALVIYLVIALATGQGFGGALLFGVLLGIFTAAVSFAIYTLIARSKRSV